MDQKKDFFDFLKNVPKEEDKGKNIITSLNKNSNKIPTRNTTDEA